MYFFSTKVDQFQSSLGHDITEIHYVGGGEVVRQTRRVDHSSTDWQESHSAWSCEPFAVVLVEKRHDSEPSIRVVVPQWVECGSPLPLAECGKEVRDALEEILQ